MEQKIYTFTEATPLVQWLEEHRDWFVGHRLERINMSPSISNGVLRLEYPLFLVLDDHCICVDYMVVSELQLLTADRNDFLVGEECDAYGKREVFFQSRLPEQDDLRLLWDPRFPAMGQRIMDVRVERFSEGFEDWEGDIKPDGDYFSTLRFLLEDGTILCIRGEMPIDDRWMDVWLENMPVIKYLRPVLTEGTLDEILEKEKAIWEITWDMRYDQKNRAEADDLARLLLEVIGYYDQLAKDYLRKHVRDEMYKDWMSYVSEPLKKLYRLNGLLDDIGDHFYEVGMNRELLDETGRTVRERLDGWLGQYFTTEDDYKYWLRRDWEENKSGGAQA